MLGQTISHYNIVEKLGQGGMGVVFRAKDTRLDRFVALKMLPPHLANLPEERERLKIEARAEANVNHPNIATIYDIIEAEDQVFIVMEYIDGNTVKDQIELGSQDIDFALDVARQIGEGLRAAHARGIIHRDIKSSNIMITADKRVKILDFGLAKIQGTSELTDAGTTIGTLMYSSPEQLHGESIDHRSDIWSLGVVLFEMLTGQLPFNGAYTQAIMYAIANGDPASLRELRPEVDTALVELTAGCLKKDPAERFNDVEEFLNALQAIDTAKAGNDLTRSAETAKTSIAVMPLQDMSPDNDQEYFCDGIADELIDALTQVKNWRVVSRTSSFVFRGKRIDVREIGDRLNITHLVEGSVRKAGNKLRITIHLINVSDGFQLWSGKYDRQLADVFEIQEEIATAIVNKLKIKLGADEEVDLVRHTTQSFEAFNIYLKARYHINERTENGLRLGLDLCEKALELDPAYAAAHSAIADSYILLGFLGAEDPVEVMPNARGAAQTALTNDAFLAEPHTTIACINAVYDWNWQEVENSFRRALQLNSGYVTAWQWFAINCLVPQRRFDEAFEALDKARELDPLSEVVAATAGLTHYFAGDYHKAESVYRNIIERSPDFAMAHLFLGRTLCQQGRFDPALTAFEVSSQMAVNDQTTIGEIGYTRALAGDLQGAREAIGQLLDLHREKQLKPFSIYSLAGIYVAMNEPYLALEWLKRAAEAHSLRLIYLAVDPVFRPLDQETDFRELLKSIDILR